MFGKQIYKLELIRKWKIYNVFYMLLQMQNTIRKERVEKNVIKLNGGNNDNREYKIKAI